MSADLAVAVPIQNVGACSQAISTMLHDLVLRARRSAAPPCANGRGADLFGNQFRCRLLAPREPLAATDPRAAPGATNPAADLAATTELDLQQVGR